MTKDEFVEIHGEDAWKEFVKPLKEHPEPTTASNTNSIADFRLKTMLVFLGFNPKHVWDNKVGIEKAREIIKNS